MNPLRRLIVKPGSSVRLSEFDPAATMGHDPESDQINRLLKRNIERMFDLQGRMWAEDRRSLLIILQGMDTSGKDGTIRHVMTGLNPLGVTVTSFKKPSALEADHDFLWRVHAAAPGKGEIAVFNRSHYEDVLIARVHRWIDKEECGRRYRHINHFERLLADSGTIILKFFLHISKGEQKRRLEERLRNPVKNWKIGVEDVKERAFWAGYMRAYERAISVCSTEAAPWFIIPSDHKPVRNALVSEIIVRTLETVRFRLPRAAPGLARLRIR